MKFLFFKKYSDEYVFLILFISSFSPGKETTDSSEYLFTQQNNGTQATGKT
jgi:hypothetical protein